MCIFPLRLNLYLKLQLLILSAVNILCFYSNEGEGSKLKNDQKKRKGKTEHCGVSTYQKLLYFCLLPMICIEIWI